MQLVRCCVAHGGQRLIQGRPRVVRYRNARVAWRALYDETGTLISGSSYMRGELQSGMFGINYFAPQMSNTNVDTSRTLSPATYIWLGYVHDHYGHFLLSTLQRLWALDAFDVSNVICLTPYMDRERIDASSFAAELFAACGLSRAQIVEVKDGDIIPEVVVPQPMFVEASHGYAGWAPFMGALGDRIQPHAAPQPVHAPVYLTRQRLQAGTRGLRREDELSASLERRGVVVVAPETLTIAGQIDLWRNARILVGLAGSSFHTAAFTSGKRLLTLHSTKRAQGNQVLLDAICGHTAIYANAGAFLASVGARIDGFDVVEEIIDPEALADAVLRAIDTLETTCGMQPMGESETLAVARRLDEPFGRNVARGKNCRMSSVDTIWAASVDDIAGEAQGLVSGRRSTTYQAHSETEVGPWWEVDLGSPHHINEIRIFNRVDMGFERARKLVIETSDDGQTWCERQRRDAESDFGAYGGQAFHTWWPDRPVEARFVRVKLDATNCLHLDQVEVIGCSSLEAGALTF